MTRKRKQPGAAKSIRERAEELYRTTPRQLERMSKADVETLIQELQIHQIELEMQNDELHKAQQDLELSRAKYLDLYEFAPVGYVTLDQDGGILEANITAATLFGRDRTLVLNRKLQGLVTAPFQSVLKTYLKRLFQSGQKQSCEIQILRSDGSLCWCRLNGIVGDVSDAPSKAQARVTLTDISQRKLAEHALQDLNETLEQRIVHRTESLLRYQQQLRALVTELTLTEQRERRHLCQELHDYLAQMLAVCKIKIGHMQRGASDETVRLEYADLDRMLSEALNYTRSLMTQLSPSVLYEFGLGYALTWLGGQMNTHHLQVNVQVESSFESIQESHAILVYHAVRELLLNIVKHAAVGHANVRLAQTASQEITVVVSDQGKGFDPVDTRLSDSQPMDHFGLFHIQERVEGIGGRFILESVPGQGTTATLVVPMRGMAESRLQNPSSSVTSAHAQKNESGESALTPIRLMLVDDHESVRQEIRVSLEAQTDLTVVAEAVNGWDAVDKARALQPDVVIMDINMPELNGIDATRLIKQEMPSIVVIGLSVYRDPLLGATMRSAGAVDLLIKGESTQQIAAAIRQAMGFSSN